MKPKTKYAIYRNGERISEWFKDHIAALLIGIDRGYFKLVNGAKWNTETKTLTFTTNYLDIIYSIPKAPDNYEIVKITKEIWS